MKSIVTKYLDYCLFCGKPVECAHHLIFGNSSRQLADHDGLIIPACNRCHNMGSIPERIHENSMAEKMSKIIGQLSWEKKKIADGYDPDQAREMFRQRYKKSYL